MNAPPGCLEPPSLLWLLNSLTWSFYIFSLCTLFLCGTSCHFITSTYLRSYLAKLGVFFLDFFTKPKLVSQSISKYIQERQNVIHSTCHCTQLQPSQQTISRWLIIETIDTAAAAYRSKRLNELVNA